MENLKNKIKKKFMPWWYSTTEIQTHIANLKFKWKKRFGTFDNNYEINPSSDWNLVIDDKFENGVDKTKWRTNYKWGTIHPDTPFQYMDPDAVQIKDNKLNLLTIINPKTFTEYGNEYSPKWGVGVIEWKEPFRGDRIFELRCKIPKCHESNPAFWTYGEETWPPEMDFFEFLGYYTPKDIKMSINLHYKSDYTEHSGVSTMFATMLPFDLVTDEINTYTCIWTDKVIEIQFNGVTVRKIKNKTLIDKMNAQPQWFTIGNHFMSDPEIVHGPDYAGTNPFVIESIKAWVK